MSKEPQMIQQPDLSELKNLKELKAELAEARDNVEELDQARNELVAHYSEVTNQLQARNTELEKALRKYGEHLIGCQPQHVSLKVCACGLDQALGNEEGEENGDRATSNNIG